MEQFRTINIGGKDRPVVFRMKAVKLFQELTGENLLKLNVAEFVFVKMDAAKILAMVYAAMVCGFYVKNGFEKKPDFTLDEIETWLELDYKAFGEVVEAWLDFVPGYREKVKEGLVKGLEEEKNADQGNSSTPREAGTSIGTELKK